MTLPDVNVWLALISNLHSHHRAALEWFDGMGAQEANFCRITQLSLLRLLTNAKVMGTDALSQREAWSVFQTFSADFRVAFLMEPEQVERQWRRFSSLPSPSPNQWADGYLAAFASECGLTLVTFDQGFRMYRGLRCVILQP